MILKKTALVRGDGSAMKKPFRCILLAGTITAALIVFTGVGWSQEAPTESSVVPPPASDVVNIAPDGTFELHGQSADLRLVLKQLSRQGKKNIIAAKGVEGEISMDLYGVTFAQALEAVLHSSGLVSQKKDDFIFVFTAEEFAAVEKATQKMEVRVFRLNYLTAPDAGKLIEDVLSEEGSVGLTPAPESGIEASPEITGGKSHATDAILVVRDYEENLETIARVLSELDIRPQQVLIEATILSAELDDDSALGIDLEMLNGVDFRTFGATSDLTGLAVPQPPAPVPPPWGGVTDFDNPQSRISTNFTANMPTALGPPFTFGIISDNIGAFIHALEAVTDVTVLANPKLLIVNKQRGEVLVGRRNGYVTTTVTETTAVQTVEFLETGTRLIVRPFIASDGYIRMEIHPEDSTGSVTQVGTTGLALPNENTAEATTNIMVRDGKTIVMGGLFREQTDLVRRQVPLLGDIPWVGTLFRSTVDVISRHEVIILITPRIIDYPSAEAVGQRAKEDAERYRIGARKGLQWWARTRLAEKNMFWARRADTSSRPPVARRGDRSESPQGLWYRKTSRGPR